MIYYVSADGYHKSGDSESTSISLYRLSEIRLENNDIVLFKAGDIFYEPIRYNKAKEDKVLFSSYGVSEKRPTFSMIRIVENENSWTYDGNNIWKIDLSDNTKYSGTQSVDDECNNIGYIFDPINEIIYPNKKESKELLTENFDFYNDDSFLYVYCDSNPNAKCEKLYLSANISILPVKSNMIIENLNFNHGGAHAIFGIDNPENVVIRNNIINYMGGSQLTAWSYGFMRYGNGIEFLEYGKNILIENNKISNVYDTATTIQGSNGKWDNVTIKNNIFQNNSQAFEIWSEKEINTESYMKNITFSNNICIGQGRGWGYCRIDKIKACEFEMQFMQIDDFRITIENNIFYDPIRLYYLDPAYETKFKNKVISNNNIIYLRNDAFLINDYNYTINDREAFINRYNKESISIFTEINDELLSQKTFSNISHLKKFFENFILKKNDNFLYENENSFITIQNENDLGFVPILSIYTNTKGDYAFIKCIVSELLKDDFQMGELYLKVQQDVEIGQPPKVYVSFENIKGNILTESNFYYTVYLFENYNMITLYFKFDKKDMQVKGSEIFRHRIGSCEIRYINEFNIMNTPGGAVCFTEKSNL